MQAEGFADEISNANLMNSMDNMMDIVKTRMLKTQERERE